jgi:zinc protease
MNRAFKPRQTLAALAALIAFALVIQLASAGQPPKTPTKTATVEGITEYRLNNGARFLLFPDPSASTVTVNMTVLVGSRHEGYGETGMAHLLEHMLFKGTPTFPNIDKALQDHGAAEANGTTWVDRTNYYETMPASDKNLEFGIKLEADRLVNSYVKREDLLKEMTVVRNEFERNENDPETILSQRMMAVAYEWHNYGKTTMGNRSDIERVPIDRLQAFYRKYYQPDNIMVVIAGKFESDKALGYLSKYFGALKRPSRVLEQTYTEEPPQDGERTVTLRRVGKVAVVGVMYHTPAAAHPDFPAADVMETLLTTAPSGRLYKALVETKKATSVTGGLTAWHDPGMLEISARVSDSVAPAEVRDTMLKVIEGLAETKITDEEVERAKRQILAQIERRLANSKRVAIDLSEWAGAGDWRLLFIYRDRVAKVTTADVQRVAAAYLKPTNRTVGTYLPTTQVARTVVPETPSVAELVKDYRGSATVAAGEAFDPTPANIEKRVQRTQLPGGVRVALLPKKTRGEVVVGQLVLHFGNEKSLTGQQSATQFLGPLMMRGTSKHTREQITDLLDKLGAKLSAGSTVGQLTFSFQAKRRTLPAALDLLGEILREPTFPENEFEILKRNQKQALEKALTDPDSLAERALLRRLSPYPADNIRYVPTVEESIQRVAAVTRGQVAKLYHDQLGAQKGELVLVGDFDPDPAVKKVASFVARRKAAVPYERISRTAKTDVAGARQVILTPDKENAVYLAGLSLPLTDRSPEYPALTIGNYLLGASGVSRLFDRLRQKEGLSYTVGSEFSADPLDKNAQFTLYAIANPANMDKADKAALEVLRKLLKEGVTEAELDQAKKGYLEELKLARANDSHLASTLRQGLYLDRNFLYYADLEQRMQALTADDVNRALRANLLPDRLVIIKAGDFQKATVPGPQK